MDSSALIASIQSAFMERKGVASLLLQNHLYGCFIVMEDLAQGILEIEGQYLTGNALYLNLDTQFGQMGIRYYGFMMDGKAILSDLPDGYKEAWLGLFHAAAKGKEIKDGDRVEEEVLAVIEASVEPGDCYFKNALEYEGNLSPDWVERALYMLHPELGQSGASLVQSGAGQGQGQVEQGQGQGQGQGDTSSEKVSVRRRKTSGSRSEKGREGRVGRGLSMTRRKTRGSTSTSCPKWATTRRRSVRERERILLDGRE